MDKRVLTISLVDRMLARTALTTRAVYVEVVRQAVLVFHLHDVGIFSETFPSTAGDLCILLFALRYLVVIYLFWNMLWAVRSR